MVKHESKFWLELKNKTPNISWTRIENTSALGTPDLLGYNKNQHFFTVERKKPSLLVAINFMLVPRYYRL
jgi:hypothetical protein